MLERLTERIIDFRRDRDWEQFHRPKELAAGLAIEAAELQELFLWREGELSTEIVVDEERHQRIAEEIGDIGIFLLMLCHDLGLDLETAVEAKLEKNASRYPVGEYKGQARKAPH